LRGGPGCREHAGGLEHPLAKKLGVEAGMAVALLAEPAGFRDAVLGELPDGVTRNGVSHVPDFRTHLFVDTGLTVTLLRDPRARGPARRADAHRAERFGQGHVERVVGGADVPQLPGAREERASMRPMRR